MTATGGKNTAQAFAPSQVKIYTAEFGTAMPADATTAVEDDFFDYGFLAEEGLAWNEEKTVNQTFDYEGNLVREVVTRRVYTLEATLLQQNSQVLKTTHGGGFVVVSGGLATFTPPVGRTNDPFATIFEWVDGADAHRILVPKVTSSVGAARPFGQGVVAIPLRLTVTATIGVAPWTEITNDVVNFPALAA